eukprot:scaffold300_cov375-Prasinococcus_capsulatus_cf.AAC.1
MAADSYPILRIDDGAAAIGANEYWILLRLQVAPGRPQRPVAIRARCSSAGSSSGSSSGSTCTCPPGGAAGEPVAGAQAGTCTVLYVGRGRWPGGGAPLHTCPCPCSPSRRQGGSPGGDAKPGDGLGEPCARSGAWGGTCPPFACRRLNQPTTTTTSRKRAALAFGCSSVRSFVRLNV